MKHKFLMKNKKIEEGIIETKSKNLIHKIRDVLRLSEGDKVLLKSGKKIDGKAQIRKIEKEKIVFDVNEIIKNNNEPPVDTILYVSILKNKNFELVVRKAVEVGVKRIVPLKTRNTVKLSFKRKRLERIIKNAVEQSNRGVCPKLDKIKKFKEAIERSKDNDINIIFSLRKGEDVKKKEIKKAGVFVGPEGGWSKKELEKARNSGFNFKNLGDITLRAETAAIVGSYVCAHNML